MKSKRGRKYKISSSKFQVPNSEFLVVDAASCKKLRVGNLGTRQ
ncbi:hypothetical protein NC99_40430 [Sunxiuqinia dokdonensis]|uniref:Uncharacterized protein n=1 Tax=Sunxiuqinia dokdonensis TaxID=1409788 RepID=A0A0L8V417_9BACT|nr:hypothetical protein NC99_40430 [Sunxiuqinia dokdonensis]